MLCANGTWLPGTFFAHFFKEYDFSVRHYHVVQREESAIELKIVPEAGYSRSVEEQIVQGLKKFMGERMRIDVQLVDQIPLVRTGKRTGVVSHLQFDFQKLADSSSSNE